MIVAAKSAAADAVSRIFREREARKLYAALVVGHSSWDTTRWDERIMPSKRRFKQSIPKRARAPVPSRCRRAVPARGRAHGQDAFAMAGAANRPAAPTEGMRTPRAWHRGRSDGRDDRLMYRMFLHAAALEMPFSWTATMHRPGRSDAMRLWARVGGRTCLMRRSCCGRQKNGRTPRRCSFRPS